MKYVLECHKNKAPSLKIQFRKIQQPVNERNIKQMFPLFPNIFRIPREKPQRVFYYAPVVVNIWHKLSPVHQSQDRNSVFLQLTDTVHNPQWRPQLFFFLYLSSLFFSPCFSVFGSVCFIARRKQHRKWLFVPFVNCIVNEPPKEGVTNAVKGSRMREFKIF